MLITPKMTVTKYCKSKGQIKTGKYFKIASLILNQKLPVHNYTDITINFNKRYFSRKH